MSATESDTAIVVTVAEKRIDAAVAVRFKDRLRELTENSPMGVILDLSEVEFLDSSGLGAVVGSMKQLGRARRLDLAGLTPTVEKEFPSREARKDLTHPWPARKLPSSAPE